MMTVFIGGSRAVSRLTPIIRDKLDDLIRRNCQIFVGDANGADRAVQQHFLDRGYRNMTVYCMDRYRNNLGAWPLKHITKPGGAKDFAYYAAKDLAMANDARCGVMLWDGKSKGTLNNIQNLVSSGKKALVYLAPEKTFHKLSSDLDLRELLSRCDQANIEQAQRQIGSKLSSRTQLSLHPTHS